MSWKEKYLLEHFVQEKAAFETNWIQTMFSCNPDWQNIITSTVTNKCSKPWQSPPQTQTLHFKAVYIKNKIPKIFLWEGEIHSKRLQF